MIRCDGFELAGFHAAAFFSNLQLAPRRVLTHFLNAFSDVFDGDPVSLPVPADSPPEIPRLMFVNRIQSLRFDVSLARVDLRWQRPAHGPSTVSSDLGGIAIKTINEFGVVTGAKPGRLGVVVQRFQITEAPGLALADHFCKPELLSSDPRSKGPLNRPENFEIHAHKMYEFHGFRINSWVRCKTGLIARDNAQLPAIVIEQDINTPGENLESHELTAEQVRGFYGATIPELDSVLRVYFPTGA